MDVAALTRGVQAGDEAAFEAFYAAYADRMYRYLLVASRGDEERARDVLQESLVRFIRHVPPLPTSEELWRWLAVVMRSAWIDRTRRDARARSLPLDLVNDPAAEERSTDRLHALLEEAVAALSPEDRRLVEEHYFQGASPAELAERREASPKALAMRLSRARRRMRDFITEGLRRG